ncbi:hypothetical protein pEaSNUABM54_00072 [Erwinia phage pEa_SNUABM_54]|nr:hypothetical protein pEaSNUABM54_00072 [Erwinia phage pEa_SNUABM_54]
MFYRFMNALVNVALVVSVGTLAYTWYKFHGL